MNEQIRIGWASTSITPDRPVFLCGQMYARISEYVHDPVTATALALESGAEQAIFVSLDMVSVLEEQCERARGAVDGVDGIDAAKITFSATHTHNSSQFAGDQFRYGNVEQLGEEKVARVEEPDDILKDEEAADFLQEKLVEVILCAWRARSPGGINLASDYAAVAFNRRPVFGLDDGGTESIMYGACSRDNFLRFEGASDHTIDMLYTWDSGRNLTGVLVDVPCPSQVFELHRFITADYWGPTRELLREELGNIHVLSICGAAGDQNPIDLVRISRHNETALRDWNAQEGEVWRNFDMALECRGIAERITEAVLRGLRRTQGQIHTRPVFRHQALRLELPLRKVERADYEEARARIERARADIPGRLSFAQQVPLFEPVGVLARWELQQRTDAFAFQMNLLRLEHAGFATSPFELFVEYAMRIRARARAEQVFLFQLTNGSGGYLPTRSAVEGGSYSSKPASTKVGPEGGDALVAHTLRALDALWA